MKFKSALKYYLYVIAKRVGIYYIVIICLGILGLILNTLYPDNFDINITGWDGLSIIFIFICYLCSFTAPFHLMITNGVSRRTFFKALITSTVILVVFIDMVDNVICSAAFNGYSIFYTTYFSKYYIISGNSIQIFSEGFLWRIFVYMAFAMLGFLIATIFYNIKRTYVRFIVVSLLVLFVFILPSIYIGNGEPIFNLYDYIGKFFNIIYGIDAQNPYIAILSNAIAITAFGSLSYIVIRRSEAF